MEKDINIRRVKWGDENILAYIQTESWKEAFKTILSKDDLEKYTDINAAIEMYTVLLKENIANGFILLINNNPHCIAYFDKARDEQMVGFSELICIHSLSKNWGNGYGSMMMEYILNEMRKLGFKNVMLWVFKENIRARNFYEKHGFVLTENTKEFCGAIEVMYYMEL